MKKQTRFFALLLSLVMLFTMGLGTAAFAADIDTGVGDNTEDFLGGGKEKFIVHFVVDPAKGSMDGEEEVLVDSGSVIPELKIPVVEPLPGWEFAGWIVEYYEDEGIIDTDKYRVRKEIYLIAQFSNGNDELLNKADHFAYMKGDEKGNFRPDAYMTRAEAATVFYNLLLNKNVPQTKTFPDVAADAWYKDAVLTLASLGIINGMPNGNFAPMNPISRAEFAAIASRFDKLSVGSITFPDVPADHWAYRYINSAAEKGWVGGMPDGTFHPNDKINRASVAKITNGVLERVPDQQFIDSNEVRVFGDLNNQHWAYYQIMEATNDHDYTREGKVETWTLVK